MPWYVFYKPWFQRVNRKVVILDGSMEEILLPNPCPLGWRHEIFCVLSYLRARFSELLPKLLYKNSNHHCVWVIANTPLITVKRETYKTIRETNEYFLRFLRTLSWFDLIKQIKPIDNHFWSTTVFDYLCYSAKTLLPPPTEGAENETELFYIPFQVQVYGKAVLFTSRAAAWSSGTWMNGERERQRDR